MSAKWAVWYMRYYAVGVELFDDEHDAVVWADRAEDNGWCSVQGVQAPDGITTPRREWTAYKQYQDEIDEMLERIRREVAETPPPATRRVDDPFGGGQATVLESEWRDLPGSDCGGSRRSSPTTPSAAGRTPSPR